VLVVSQEEEERDGLRLVGMGTWRKPKLVCILLQQRRLNLAWAFPVPPIPITLEHPFLLFAYSAVLAIKNKGTHAHMGMVR